jgi:hypothetical protein
VPGPGWNDDDPRDAATLQANVKALASTLRADAPGRGVPTSQLAFEWHRQLYAGCQIPSAQYVGAFRGDPAHPDLTDYEVGLGGRMPDGGMEKEGLPVPLVAPAVDGLLSSLGGVLATFDAAWPVGVYPASVDELGALLSVAAQLHGEWVRIHPFANGNGRTARTWVTWVMLRYGLPTFVTLKPRPSDVAYARAAHASMGRRPDYTGDHTLTEQVFALMLSTSLLP